MYVYIRGCRKQ